MVSSDARDGGRSDDGEENSGGQSLTSTAAKCSGPGEGRSSPGDSVAYSGGRRLKPARGGSEQTGGVGDRWRPKQRGAARFVASGGPRLPFVALVGAVDDGEHARQLRRARRGQWPRQLRRSGHGSARLRWQRGETAVESEDE